MSSVSRQKHVDDEPRGLIPALLSTGKNAILAPVRPFVSRPALRAYLTTILALSTALILLVYAVIGYLLFYYSYIPRIGFERPIHLQFDSVFNSHAPARVSNPYPYGTTHLAPDLVSAQGYDVWIELALPRTRENEEAGNFMIEVKLYAQSEKDRKGASSGNILSSLRADIAATTTSYDSSSLLAVSRRPAILPYRSYPIDLLHKAAYAPLYLFNFYSESHTLRIPVFHQIDFAKGPKAVPSTLHLELQSSSRLQIYEAKAQFRARFVGLRWFMYNWRITAGIVFITAFWLTEIVFAGLAWGLVAVYVRKPQSEEKKIKSEDEEGEEEDPAAPLKLSDTERTFPTLGGQPALRYESPAIKHEPEDDAAPVMLIPEAVTRGADADDEDDMEDVDFFDSGIGTSLDSADPARRDSIRRRRGRVGRQEDDDAKRPQ